jgi:hypothetical protein
LSAGSKRQHTADLLDGRVRVKWSNDNLELRVDSGLLLGIGTNERDGSDSFTVKTEILDVSFGAARST